MAKSKAKLKAEGKYKGNINGHYLIGVKLNGKWSWSCPSWPDLVDKHNGCADGSECIDEFERRARGEAEQGDQQKASA